MNNHKTITQVETIEIIRELNTESNSFWQPKEGQTICDLKKQVLDSGISEVEWETIKTEAVSVLSKCVNPLTSSKQKTGLVIGYVQSGKTMSFTTVAALARDNGYQIVIVIAGTSVNLLNQSTKRLEDDLNLHDRLNRKWMHFKNPEFESGDHTNIENALADLRDSKVPEWERQTVLITVMKQHQHLEKLVDILSRIELSETPTLVIDDEGDQASLNTMVKQGEASTTYKRILSLRERLPCHTFLQYTATPQAPLLINLIDMLSPNFAKVLSPGIGYKGGKAFFQQDEQLIRIIPDSEIPTKDRPLRGPPESLLKAMRIFFLGTTSGIILNKSEGTRSMMVHPTHKTIGHKQYYHWIESIKNNWLEILELDKDEIDYKDLLQEFMDSYEDLQSTVSNLPSFDELSNQLLRAIRKTQLHEVNATGGRTPSIPWSNAYAHILVGGKAMDRGFTVEGLTVTYMPRDPGLGNADTIQQRARFFGYKEKDFGYCRVFLKERVRTAYRHYVIHEEDVRERLLAHDKTGKPLDTWKRAFFLDRSLRATRHNVLGIDYYQGRYHNNWYTPKAPHDSMKAINANRDIVFRFLQKLSLQEDEQSKKINEFRHDVAIDIRLKDVYEELLVPLQVTRSGDSTKFTGVRLQIAAYLDEHPDATCTVYQMSKGMPRKRTLNERDEVETLFQGPSPKTGEIYKGDRKIRASKGVTIQIHNLTVVREDEDPLSNVPAVAIWLPKDVSSVDWLVQNQGGSYTQH